MPSLLRPMLPSVGGFSISSDGYFLTGVLVPCYNLDESVSALKGF